MAINNNIAGTRDVELIQAFEINIGILEQKVDETIEQIRQLEKQNCNTSVLEAKIDRLNKSGEILLTELENELKRIRNKFMS